MTTEIEKLYEMIDDLEVAMMVTRRPDGHLVSRAMANQKHAPGADLWFVTSTATQKLDELEDEPYVNLSYYKDSTREWVSVSGLAKISQDRETIRKLWADDWKMWFGKGDGDPKSGTPDDPRIALIGIDVQSAVFFEMDKPQPVVLYELVKGWVTGKEPDLGKMHQVRGNAD